jgi:periplasmic protein TonB
MKIFYLIAAVVLFSVPAFSQATLSSREFLDSNGNKVDSANADFIRTYKKEGRGYLVKDYYITGEPEMVAECSNISPIVKEGKTTSYYKNGQVKEEGNYSKNLRTGLHTSYHENGKKKSEVEHDELKIRHVQHWDEKGTPLLINGKGIVSEIFRKGTTSIQEIEDFETKLSYSIADGSADTIYTLVEQQPEYPGGYEKIMRDIRANVYYPKSARRKNISGTVYVQFIVDRKGQVIEPAVIRGIETECDEIARIAVTKLGRWQPGRVRDKPVSVRYVLPVKYKLS